MFTKMNFEGKLDVFPPLSGGVSSSHVILLPVLSAYSSYSDGSGQKFQTACNQILQEREWLEDKDMPICVLGIFSSNTCMTSRVSYISSVPSS